MGHLLELENLSIGYKNIIFKNINAHLKTGEVTALMGVNGTGKTCLLKTIGHLVNPLQGKIKFLEKYYNQYSALEFAKLASLVLTEKFQVDFLKVEELISLGRSPYTNWRGNLLNDDLKIVSTVMAEVGILDLKDLFFSELSDGQKQKVMIGRALAQSPRLLILDEPTTYLDIPSRVELMKLLVKIAKEKKVAVIMSTHDLDLVESSVDHIWLMGKDGSFSEGGPKDFRSSGLFEKNFYS